MIPDRYLLYRGTTSYALLYSMLTFECLHNILCINLYTSSNPCVSKLSDFCHCGGRFDYQPYDKSKGRVHEYIEWLDRQGIDLIVNKVRDIHGWGRWCTYMVIFVSSVFCPSCPCKNLTHSPITPFSPTFPLGRTATVSLNISRRHGIPSAAGIQSYCSSLRSRKWPFLP